MPAQPTTPPNVEDFARKYGPAAARAGRELGVDPAILLGQWGLETGWGKSVIPGTNNLGNIKDFSGAGVEATDNATGSRDKYRQYDSPEAFADDYVALVRNKYADAAGAGSDDGKYAAALKSGGYAEDPAYARKVGSATNLVRRIGEGLVNMLVPPASAETLPSDGGRRLNWSDVVASDRYKALSPEKQEYARDQYFERVVRPRIPANLSVDEVRAAFDSRTSPKASSRPGIFDQAASDFSRGISGLKNIGIGLGALAADLVGADETADRLLGEYVANEARVAKENPAVIGTYKNIENLGDAGRYAVEAVAENLPMFVPSLLSGGIGAVAARKIAQKAVGDFVEKQVVQGVARQAAEKQAAQMVARRMTAGMAAGAAASSIGMESGNIYGDVYKDTGKKEPGLSVAFGVPAGLLDAIEPVYALRKLYGPVADQLAVGIIKRMGKEAGKQFLIEAGTEGLQTMLEEAPKSVSTGEAYWTPDLLDKVIDAGLKGGVAGGTLGGVTGLRGGGKKSKSIGDKYAGEAARRAAEGEEPAAPLGLPSPGSQDPLVVDADGQAMNRENAAARNHPGRVRFADGKGDSVSWDVDENGNPVHEDAAPPALPAPTITVGADGTAKTASQRTESAALDELERWARQELGYTDDVQAAGRRHPGRPEADPQPPADSRDPGRPQLVTPSDDAGNGFKHGPGGYRYRTGESSAAGGALALEKRSPGGSASTFYVGKNGGLIDADGVAFNNPADLAQLWIPENESQRDQALGIMDDMGQLDLKDPRRAELKTRLKNLVTGGEPQPAVTTPVDEAAHAAQTSPFDGAIEPTDGQKEAGNYRKGHVRVAGLDISIENPEGSERRGTDPGGKPWVNRMAGHYGYVRRTEGADGDQVDVFLKPGTAEDYSGPVFVVDQVDPKTGKFDEHKVMVGYGSQKEAEKAYKASYSRGWKGMGKVTPMDMPAFKEWLKGDTTQPAAGAIQPQAASGEEARVARAHSLLPEDRRTILRRSVAAGNITQAQADERALRWAANHGMSEGDTAPGRQVKRKWTDAEWARLGLLQSARDELQNAVDNGDMTQAQADAVVEQARQTGDVAAADGVIMDAIDAALEARAGRTALEAGPSGKAADLSRQNRDRSRPASIEQMNRIANAPDYDRLGFGRSPNEAAPMVSVAGDTARIPESDMGRADRVTLGDGTKIPVRYAVIEASDALASHAADGTESAAYYAEPQPGQVRALNNGRMAGLQEAYRRKTAGAYTQAMIDDAQAHGVSPDAIRAKREPVLVRVYADAENRRPNMGALSNPQSNLGMSATEQAANDARVVPVNLLDLGDTASFDAASNRRFLDAFARTVQQQGEDAAQIRDGQGNYSRQFMDRARAAVFHRAYGDDALTAMASESADPDVRNILNALTMAAPDFAGMDAGPLDIRPQLAQAVHQIRDARSRGLNIHQHLAQQDMFGRDPLADRLVDLLWSQIRSPKKLTEALREMGLFVQNEQVSAASGDMFGGANVTVDDVVARGENLIRSRYGREQDTEQTGLFGVGRSEGSRRADSSRSGGRESTGQRRASAHNDKVQEPVARTEPAQSRVEEPGETQDLFGGFDLEPGVSPAKRGAEHSEPILHGRGPGALRLPSLRSRAAAIVVEPEGGQFAVRVEAKKTLDLRVPDGKISSPADVASALASIRKQPQENMMMLLTDEAGTPISVLRHSIGKKAATIVEPDILIGHAARVPKARNLWLVHNHPSGISELSGADQRLSDAVAKILHGASIEYKGLMAVGQDTFSNVDARGNVVKGRIAPVLRTKQIPVVERSFVKRGVLAQEVTPQNVSAIAQDVAGGLNGVLLLNVQNMPTAFLPLTADEMGKLRGTGGLEKLLAGVEKANASSGIAVVQSESDVRQARNLNSALEAAGIRAFDIVAGGRTLLSAGERVTRSDGAPFESRRSPGTGVPIARARSAANQFMSRLPGAGRLKVSVVQSVKDIPEGSRPSEMAEGVYYPASEGGRIYLVADNLPTMDRLHQVLAHEVVGHFGVEALLGRQFDGVLANVIKLARVPSGERATGREQPGDRNYATMEAVGMRYPDYDARARAREVLARMAETNGHENFLQRLYAKMRVALRALGLDLRLTNADLRQMVIDAGRFLRRTPADQAYSGMKLAAASMAASEGAHRDQIDTPAFRAWFGDSKVVDADGRPMVVYHGTDADFKTFSLKKKGANTGRGNSSLGFFFIADRTLAENFARETSGGDRIIDAYLSIQNPIDLTAAGMFTKAEQAPTLSEIFFGDRISDPDEALEAINDEIGSVGDFGEIDDALRDGNAREIMMRDGYDGAISHFGAGNLEYIAFRPEQIKSATGNRGTFDPGSRNIMESRRDDKPVDLPDAIVGRALGDAGRHPDFAAAKAGDTEAAARLVGDLVTPDVVAKVRDALAGRKPTIVPVLAVESAGNNKIPVMTAKRLGVSLGLDVDADIVQSVKAKRTALTGLDRIFQQPEFDGAVDAGKEYLLVDDTLTQGGTMAALASHIRQHGGNVVGAFALTGKQYSATLQLSPETLKTLRERYGDIESEFRAATGRGFDALTESEGRYLAKHGTPDAVRDRILAEGHARSDGLRRENLGRQEGRLNPAQDDNEAPPDAGLFNGPMESRAATLPPLRDGETLADEQRADRESALSKIGPLTPAQNIQEKFQVIREQGNARTIQGVFDDLYSLKALSKEGYMQAVLARGHDGAAEYLIKHGAVRLHQGAVDGAVIKDGEPGSRGLADILASLGEGEYEYFLAWIAGNRAKQLKAEGRENLFTDRDIAVLRDLNKGRMADGRKRIDAYAAALKEVNALQKSVMDVAEAAGLIDGETRHLWEHEFYVPFYRVMEEDNTGFMGPGQINGLTGQYAFKKLKGGTGRLGDLTANMVGNWSHLISASMKNMAAQKALTAAVDMGIARTVPAAEAGSVRIMVGGKEKHFVVDDSLVLESLTAMHYGGNNMPGMKAARAMKHALTVGVTANPAFRIRNVIRDSISAVAVDGDISNNPLANMINGWQSTAKDHPTMRHLLAGGGAVRFGSFQDGQARSVKRLIEEGHITDKGQVLTSPAAMARFVRKAFDFYQELGDRGETINRAAIYEAARRNGKSHLEASYLARDLMDFTRHGSWGTVRFMTQIVPFLNARLQGQYKLGRAVRQDFARVATVMGVVAAGSAALFLAMKDDEAYKELPDWVRNTYWVARIGDKLVYVPKPFEVGALGSVVERATEFAVSGNDYKAADLARDIYNITNDQMQLGLNSFIPQIVKPGLEAAWNWNSFGERDIDSLAQQRLPAGDRFTESTSAGAVLAGRALSVSPRRIEHAVRGYFGWLGAQALNVTDYVARPFSGMPENPRRDLARIDNWFVVGDFVMEANSPRTSKYIQRFYDVQKEANEVYAAYNNARAMGDMERAQELVQSPDAKLIGIARAANAQMTKINSAIRALERNSVPMEEKRARLDDLYLKRNRLAAIADERARAVQR